MAVTAAEEYEQVIDQLFLAFALAKKGHISLLLYAYIHTSVRPTYVKFISCTNLVCDWPSPIVCCNFCDMIDIGRDYKQINLVSDW